MASKQQICVIGLGKFGFDFGRTLVELGQEVLGLDRGPEKVRRAQGAITQALQADAMDKKVLEQLGVAEMSHVMVSVGQSIEAGTIIALHLKELGAPQIWVKAVSEDHEHLLEKIGVDRVVFPERFAATQLAHRLADPGFIEYLPFDEGIALKELTVDDWEGRTLRDIDLPNHHGVQIVAMKMPRDPGYRYLPKADEPLPKGAVLIALGPKNKLSKLKP